METFCQRALAGAIRTHDPDQKAGARLLGEGNEIPARRPHRRRVASLAEADSVLAGAVGVHDVELLGAIAIRFEDDAPPVRAIAGTGVDAVGLRQTPALARAQVHFHNRGGAAFANAHDDSLPVRGNTR